MRKKRNEAGALTAVTVLKLKLSLDAETAELLARVASECRKARNAASMDWLLRANGKPESLRQSTRLCKHAKHGDKPKTESTKLYHAARESAPGLTATVHSMLAAEVNTFLSAKLDWREGKTEDGKRPRRRDAVLSYDARPPYYTSDDIPVRSAESMLVYGDETFLRCRLVSGSITQLKLRTGSLGSGHKRLLGELASGARKLQDSQLLLKNEEWYWYLPVVYESPSVKSERQAELWPSWTEQPAAGDRPFRLCLPDRRPWGVGDGWYLKQQTIRFTLASKSVGYRYRHGEGLGHGRKKIEATRKRFSAHLANIVTEVRRQAIRDIVVQCQRAGCGTLVYREPSLIVRDKCWFAANGIDWNWTAFRESLKNSLAKQGISLVVSQLKMEEVRATAREEVGHAIAVA